MRVRRSVDKDPLESAVFFIDRSAGKKIAGPLREAGLLTHPCKSVGRPSSYRAPVFSSCS